MSWQMPMKIGELNQETMKLATERHNQLTKPMGSLGRLEEIGIQLAGIQGKTIPAADKSAIVVMAGDHGITDEGVSAFPSEVTVQMVLNFIAGGAGINALARNANASVHVVDIGVKSDIPIKDHVKGKEENRLWVEKVRYGTNNMTKGPAMTREEAEQALAVGWKIGQRLFEEGYQLVGLGEMGIGNTTTSSAVASVLTGKPLTELVGFGTGLKSEGVNLKTQAVQRAIEVNRPDPTDPIDVLAKVGGLELAGLAGLTLSCAAHRIAVVVDGFITSAAVLVAARIELSVLPYLFASHQSVEPGHRLVLDTLGLKPLFDFSLRLGEGTGAALAIPLIQGAVRVLREMATFAEAGVSDASK